MLRYTQEWRDYVTRQARWVDFDNDYKTLDLAYMESVMWAFKTLWDKGLIYEGFRVLAYCWRCETPLSNTETRMDDVYRDRQDPALTVWLELDNGDRTPDLDDHAVDACRPTWRVAVGPDIDYAVMQDADGARYILAESRLGAYAKRAGGRHAGRHDQGRRARRPPLRAAVRRTSPTRRTPSRCWRATSCRPRTAPASSTWRPASARTTRSPATPTGIPTICPMDEHGRYTAEVPDWAGVHVFDANPHVIRDLKDRGVVVRHDSYNHSYPHCWRCDQPLIYRAISSWFVKVTEFRDRMVELNQQITWVPEHVKDGQLRQVARQRPRLVDQPQPLLGLADPGVEERRPDVPTTRRLRHRSTSSSATSASR